MRRAWRIPIWMRIAVAPLLLLGVVWAVDFSAVGQQLAHAAPGWVLLALACSVASNLVSAWRWRSLVCWLGHPLRLGQAERYYFQGIAISALMPGAVVGGDVYRALALRRQGQGSFMAGLSVLLDRFSGLWMLLVLGALAAAWGCGQQTGYGIAGLGVPGLSRFLCLALALVLLTVPILTLSAMERYNRWSDWKETNRPVLQRFAQITVRLGRYAEYRRQLLGSALVQLLSVAAIACAGWSLGLGVPYWCYAVASVPIFLMASLPIGFGGWGTREAAATLSLAVFGVGAPAAVAVSVLFGLLVLPQALVGVGLWLADGRVASLDTMPVDRKTDA